MLEEPYVMPGIEVGSDVSKTNTFTPNYIISPDQALIKNKPWKNFGSHMSSMSVFYTDPHLGLWSVTFSSVWQHSTVEQASGTFLLYMTPEWYSHSPLTSGLLPQPWNHSGSSD